MIKAITVTRRYCRTQSYVRGNYTAFGWQMWLTQAEQGNIAQASHDAKSRHYWADKTKVYDNQLFIRSSSLMLLFPTVGWTFGAHCGQAQSKHINLRDVCFEVRIFFFLFMDPCIVHDSVEIPTRCSFVTEFIIPKFIEDSTCFERHTAHHQEL